MPLSMQTTCLCLGEVITVLQEERNTVKHSVDGRDMAAGKTPKTKICLSSSFISSCRLIYSVHITIFLYKLPKC